MRITASLALLFFIATHAVAQRITPGDLPLETHNEVCTSGGSTAMTRSTPIPLPEAPVPHRVIDKKFVAVMGALGGAETLRFTSRKLVLDKEFSAGAPWVTRDPSNSHVVTGHAGIYAAELLGTFELKKPHSWLPGDKIIRRLWWAYPVAMTVIHIRNGVGNIRTQGPGGCTSVACAERQAQ